MRLLRLLGVQRKVIWALLLRELHTRYGRENIGFLWMIGEPALFCVGVSVMWSIIRPSHEHGIPVTAFVITGYVPLTMWRHCVSRSMKAFEANGALLFHGQVTPLDIILARNLLEIYGSLIAGVLVAAAAILLGFMDAPKDYGLLYLGMFYQALFCLACSLILAPLSEMSDIFEKLIGAVMYLSIPFSGAFTMVDWVPHSFQSVLLVFPGVHAMEILRQGQFGSQVHAIYDVTYATWSIAVMMIIGLSLVLRSRKHIVVL